jgi:hypothetical protein
MAKVPGKIMIAVNLPEDVHREMMAALKGPLDLRAPPGALEGFLVAAVRRELAARGSQQLAPETPSVPFI